VARKVAAGHEGRQTLRACLLASLVLVVGCDADSGKAPIASGGCDFDYDETFVYVDAPVGPTPPPPPPARAASVRKAGDIGPAAVVHAEPPPDGMLPTLAYPWGRGFAPSPLLLPSYSDTMPRFPRAVAWDSPTRCYETPLGARWLTEAEAFVAYQAIALQTTGEALNVTAERRTVVGVRGAYPGRWVAHDNLPNRFNDTLGLLWIDGQGARHVREFPVNTDTGAHDFGEDASSSLWPNRRYPYVNGTHRGYSALQIDLPSYPVRDDTNHNGHWDSDRNGWLPPATGLDHDRLGTAHNIHMGSVASPLGQAVVGVWSAGCQVIPGMASWTEFITNAWTQPGDQVDYFLVDARDIDPGIW